ncbi:MAG: hypothetical protein K6L60_05600 [Oceanobacter sp.]
MKHYKETGTGAVEVAIVHGESLLAVEFDCPSDANQVLSIAQKKGHGTVFKSLGKDVDGTLAAGDVVNLEVPGTSFLKFTPSNASAEFTVRVYPG